MESLGKLILRLSVGGLMLLYGIHKLLHGIGGIKQMFASTGLPEFFAYAVYLGEVLAPVLLILGLYARFSALMIAITMLVSVVLAHPQFMQLNQYGALAIELNALYLFGALALVFLGPGKFSMGSQRSFWGA